jgi:hypothetical protein
LRFNGAGVAVGVVVRVGGRGVKVSVTGTAVGVEESGVDEASNGAGVTIPHAEKVSINKTGDQILIRAPANLI